MNNTDYNIMIVLLLIINWATVWLVRSFLIDVVKYWKPWVGVLLLLPPFGLLGFVGILLAAIASILMQIFRFLFKDYFKNK